MINIEHIIKVVDLLLIGYRLIKKMSYRIEIQILIGICKQILQTNITHQTKR